MTLIASMASRGDGVSRRRRRGDGVYVGSRTPPRTVTTVIVSACSHAQDRVGATETVGFGVGTPVVGRIDTVGFAVGHARAQE